MYVFAKCAAKVRFFPETAKLSSDYFSFGKEKSSSSPQTNCPAPAFYIKFGRKMVLAGRAMEHNMLAYVFSHVRNRFITSEKSIYHLWEKRKRRVAIWWNSVHAQAKFQRLYPKSATNLPHLPQSATNLPHIYPPVYHNDNACLWQIGRFFREKLLLNVRACVTSCESWIMSSLEKVL